LRGYAVIVISKTSRRVGEGGVCPGGQLIGTVTQFAKILQRDEGPASEGQLVTQNAVQFQGMPNGFVGLQVHDSGQEYDRAIINRALPGVERVVQFAHDALCILTEVLQVNGLPSAGVPPPEGLEFAFVHTAFAVDTVHLERGEHLGDDLFNLTSLGVDE